MGTSQGLLPMLKQALSSHVEGNSNFSGLTGVNCADCQSPLKFVLSIWWEYTFNGKLAAVTSYPFCLQIWILESEQCAKTWKRNTNL